MGFAVSKVVGNKTVVKVHTLEIFDANGKIRAEFSTESDGRPPQSASISKVSSDRIPSRRA